MGTPRRPQPLRRNNSAKESSQDSSQVAYMKKQDYADSLYYLKKAMEQNPAALELFQELCPETMTDEPNEL